MDGRNVPAPDTSSAASSFYSMNAKNRTRAALALLTSVTVALAVGSAGAQTPPTGSKATYWPLDTNAIPVTNCCTDA